MFRVYSSEFRYVLPHFHVLYLIATLGNYDFVHLIDLNDHINFANYIYDFVDLAITQNYIRSIT